MQDNGNPHSTESLLADESRENLLPDLTPLIDVIFILIVFFLLTPSLTESSINVSLPSYSSSDKTASGTIIIEIDRDGSYLYMGAETDIATIEKTLSDIRAGSKNGETGEILIRCDSGAGFGKAVSLMEAAERAGFSAVSFAVINPSVR